MAIVVFTVFYIPPGLNLFARWLNKKFSKNTLAKYKDRKRLVFMLMVVGIGICIAKFVRITPLRWEKRHYLDVAKWLKENTGTDDIIAFSHLVPRIGFYAERTTTTLQKRTSTISAGKISSGKRYHLAGTFDGKHQKLYINGKLAALSEPEFDTINVGHDNLAIGKPYAGADSYFKGSINEVRLYNKALSDKEIEGLYKHQITETENKRLIGYWPLEGDTSDMKKRPEEGMTFDGLKDYIDLSGLGPTLNVDELTVSARVKPELLDKTIWIAGNGAQFRIGIRKSSARFWIQEGPPGKNIPANATYVVVFAKKEENELQAGFDRKVQERHSVWADRKGKKSKIVIYKIL
jgi:hypothetical protein